MSTKTDRFSNVIQSRLDNSDWRTEAQAWQAAEVERREGVRGANADDPDWLRFWLIWLVVALPVGIVLWWFIFRPLATAMGY